MASRNVKLATEQRKMRLRAAQLNLRVRLEQTKQQLKSTTAQIQAMSPRRKQT